VDEILAAAILAATRDPRYPPIRPDELASLRYGVSLLERLEPVADLAELDPGPTGSSSRAPAVAEASSLDSPAAQQVVIARIKAGVGPEDPVRLFRFRTRRYAEADSDPGDPREPG
jgi:hypothetical protein